MVRGGCPNPRVSHGGHHQDKRTGGGGGGAHDEHVVAGNQAGAGRRGLGQGGEVTERSQAGWPGPGPAEFQVGVCTTKWKSAALEGGEAEATA